MSPVPLPPPPRGSTTPGTPHLARQRSISMPRRKSSRISVGQDIIDTIPAISTLPPSHPFATALRKQSTGSSSATPTDSPTRTSSSHSHVHCEPFQHAEVSSMGWDAFRSNDGATPISSSSRVPTSSTAIDISFEHQVRASVRGFRPLETAGLGDFSDSPSLASGIGSKIVRETCSPAAQSVGTGDNHLTPLRPRQFGSSSQQRIRRSSSLEPVARSSQARRDARLSLRPEPRRIDFSTRPEPTESPRARTISQSYARSNFLEPEFSVRTRSLSHTAAWSVQPRSNILPEMADLSNHLQLASESTSADDPTLAETDRAMTKLPNPEGEEAVCTQPPSQRPGRPTIDTSVSSHNSELSSVPKSAKVRGSQPFSIFDIPSADQISRARRCRLLDQNGHPVAFGDVLPTMMAAKEAEDADRPPPRTLAIFLRHLYDGMSQDYVTAVERQLNFEAVQSCNVKVVFICHGSYRVMKRYKSHLKSTFAFYTDPTPDNELYQILGMTLVSKLSTPKFPITNLETGAPKIAVSTHGLGTGLMSLGLGSPGSLHQLGGEFLFAPGTCEFVHRMAHIGGKLCVCPMLTVDNWEPGFILRSAGMPYPAPQPIRRHLPNAAKPISEQLRDAKVRAHLNFHRHYRSTPINKQGLPVTPQQMSAPERPQPDVTKFNSRMSPAEGTYSTTFSLDTRRIGVKPVNPLLLDYNDCPHAKWERP